MGVFDWLRGGSGKVESAVQDRPQGKDMEKEIAYALGGGVGQSVWQTFDPDKLRHRKGASVYLEMLRDDQVKAAFVMKRDTLVGRTWRLRRPDDSDRQKRVEDFLYHVTDRVAGSWLGLLRSVMWSMVQGYSIGEKVYGVDKWGRKDVWVLSAFKLRPSETFTFERDPYGNVVQLIQEQGGRQRKMDPRKFVVHVSNPEVDPIYGESELRAAYRPYWEKDNILKFETIWLERQAGGFVYAKQEGSNLGPSEKANLQNILKNISARTGIILPTGIELEVVHPTPSDAFERAIVRRNQAIARSLLLPNLIGVSEQGRTGSYAQARVQMEGYLLHLRQLGDLLAETVNEQIFAELAKWNYGVNEFPRLEFDPFTEEEKQGMVEAYLKAVQGGVLTVSPEDQTRTRDLIRYPVLDEEEIPERGEGMGSPSSPSPAGDGEEEDGE